MKQTQLQAVVELDLHLQKFIKKKSTKSTLYMNHKKGMQHHSLLFMNHNKTLT